jgi:hypothetical protein
MVAVARSFDLAAAARSQPKAPAPLPSVDCDPERLSGPRRDSTVDLLEARNALLEAELEDARTDLAAARAEAAALRARLSALLLAEPEVAATPPPPPPPSPWAPAASASALSASGRSSGILAYRPLPSGGGSTKPLAALEVLAGIKPPPPRRPLRYADHARFAALRAAYCAALAAQRAEGAAGRGTGRHWALRVLSSASAVDADAARVAVMVDGVVELFASNCVPLDLRRIGGGAPRWRLGARGAVLMPALVNGRLMARAGGGLACVFEWLARQPVPAPG